MAIMNKKKATHGRNLKVIEADYHPLKDWKMDPVGYFLIRIDKKTMMIEVGFCREGNVVEMRFHGKDAIKLYNTILRHLTLTPEHTAYLGKELMKAEVALHLGIDFVQDSPLDMRGVKKTKKHPPIENIHNYCLDTRSVWTKHPRK